VFVPVPLCWERERRIRDRDLMPAQKIGKKVRTRPERTNGHIGLQIIRKRQGPMPVGEKAIRTSRPSVPHKNSGLLGRKIKENEQIRKEAAVRGKFVTLSSYSKGLCEDDTIKFFSSHDDQKKNGPVETLYPAEILLLRSLLGGNGPGWLRPTTPF